MPRLCQAKNAEIAMLTDKNFEEMLQRLMQVYHVDSQAALMEQLGRHATAVTSARKTREIPEAWLYQAAYECDCRIEWLRTGEGSIYRRERTLVSLAPIVRQLIAVIEELPPHSQEVVLRCARLMGASSGETRASVKLLIETFERLHWLETNPPDFSSRAQ
jgi:Bacteriophage CI repressor helix-turn-helix domain